MQVSERKRCPVCCEEVPVRFIESWREFRIWRCSACEVQFADPMVYSYDIYSGAYGDPSSQLAQDTGFSNHVEEGDRLAKMPNVRPFLTPLERVAIKWVSSRFKQGTPVLDLGCGPGRFLMALNQNGFRAYGIDVAKPPIDMLKRHGLSVAQGSVEAYPASREDPEVVCCFEVLEHVPSPVNFLQTLRERFPKAWVVLSVPVPLSERCQFMDGFKREADYPPNHLTRWTPESLKKAFEKSGYEVQISKVHVGGDDLGFSLGLGLRRLSFRLFRAIMRSVSQGPKESLFGDVMADVRHLTLLKHIQRYAFLPLVLVARLAGKSGYAYLTIARPRAEMTEKGLH